MLLLLCELSVEEQYINTIDEVTGYLWGGLFFLTFFFALSGLAWHKVALKLVAQI